MTTTIIDGISLAGKSIVLQEIQKNLLKTQPNFSKLFISEHLTERFFENKHPSIDDIHRHVSRILHSGLTLKEMQEESPFSNQNILTIFIERLFLTFMSRGLMTEAFFTENDKLIQRANIKNITLVIPERHIKERIETSLLHRNPRWKDFIETLGGVSMTVNHFSQQQEKMLALNTVLANYIETEVITINDISELKNTLVIERIVNRAH